MQFVQCTMRLAEWISIDINAGITMPLEIGKNTFLEPSEPSAPHLATLTCKPALKSLTAARGGLLLPPTLGQLYYLCQPSLAKEQQ